jgi:ribosome assembly protein YihI (activator of Der GTPase)
MAERIQTPKTTAKRESSAEAAAAPKVRTEEQQAALDASDALLDEIDNLFEELGLNSEEEAQDFVENYRQKGGE